MNKTMVGNKKYALLVDVCFYEVSKNAQRFLIVNEMGRRENDSDRKADMYAKDHIGEYATYMAMYELVHYYLKRNVDMAARYMVRMSDLGYNTSMFSIESSDGSASFGVGELRKILNAKKSIANI